VYNKYFLLFKLCFVSGLLLKAETRLFKVLQLPLWLKDKVALITMYKHYYIRKEKFICRFQYNFDIKKEVM